MTRPESVCVDARRADGARLNGVRPRGLESGSAETAAWPRQHNRYIGRQAVTVLEQRVQACALRDEQAEPEVAQVPQRQRTVDRLGELDPQER